MRRRLFKTCGLAFAAFLLLSGAYLGGIQITGNFDTVIAGELYRSNQPTALRLAEDVKRYGIRTVVNLRGRDDGAAWYREETTAAAELGLHHVDFAMSATRALTPDESRQLVALLRDAPKPILVHCKSGSDRTGLVAALYLHAIDGVDAETAEKQLSIRFGHIGIPYLSPTYAMDENWEDLEKTRFGTRS